MTSEWEWRPAPKEITLETLFRPQDKFCFLAGSGISLDPPSCLPTAYQFTQALLERLIPQQERSNILALINPEREGMQDPGDFLRFYQLMEYLQRWYDPDLLHLDGFMECTTPNFNHLFLAQMLTQGHPVLTTNFDSLIEYALLEQGIPQNQIYPLILRQDWESRMRGKQYRVHKLHGSLFDVRHERECRESLQATLAQIAQEKGEIFQLEPSKRQILQPILQHHDLVVLWYSGLEDFDVMPTLWTIPSPMRILWVSHMNQPPTDVQIEVIKVRSSHRAQYSPVPGDRIGQNLLTFGQYQTRQPAQLIRIMVHTKQLLAWMWNRYVRRPRPAIDSFSCPEAEIAIHDFLTLAESGQWVLTGQIFADRNLLSQGLQAYQTALTLAQDEENKHRQGTCLNNIGNLLHDQGRVDEALAHYQQALQIAEQLGDLRGKATCLNNIGNLLRDQGRIDEALAHYQQALQIAEQLKALKLVKFIINNITDIRRKQ